MVNPIFGLRLIRAFCIWVCRKCLLLISRLLRRLAVYMCHAAVALRGCQDVGHAIGFI